jgi:hypothetical protein
METCRPRPLPKPPKIGRKCPCPFGQLPTDCRVRPGKVTTQTRRSQCESRVGGSRSASSSFLDSHRLAARPWSSRPMTRGAMSATGSMGNGCVFEPRESNFTEVRAEDSLTGLAVLRPACLLASIGCFPAFARERRDPDSCTLHSFPNIPSQKTMTWAGGPAGRLSEQGARAIRRGSDFVGFRVR